MRRFLVVSAIGLIVTASTAASRAASDDITVQARADATRIGAGDSLTLTVEVRGSNPGRVDEPDLSGLADFTIASGPGVSTSTSMMWSGGQATSTTSKQFTYVLLPRRRGTLTIPSVSVRLDSRVRQTNPITVEVVEGRLRPAAPGGGRGAFPGLPGRRRPAAEPPTGDIIVESTVDKQEAYVGEQLLLIYKVYTQLKLVEVPSPQQLPAYTGFWVEEIPVDPRATIHRVARGGKDYVEITLMKKALFPTTSGDLTIEETAFGLPVEAPNRDPFDSIFFTPTSVVYRKTAPLTIHVKPLPEEGRPASFNGAVGHYTLTAQADRDQTRVSEALGLKLVAKGAGNIRVVGEPLLPPLPDYKKYEPRVEEKKEIAQDRLVGSKTWDYVLTPLAPGAQEIAPIRFAYFDPAKGAYVESSTPPIPVQVLRAEASGTMAGPAPAGRRDVAAFGHDIRYIKPASALAGSGAPFHRSATFVTLMVGPLLLNAGLLFAVRRRDHLLANAGLLRGRKAPGFARRRLKQARSMLAARRSREFHQEVAQAVIGYLGDKLDTSASGLTHEAIDALLADRGVNAPLRERTRRCLEICDYARFAPAAPGLDEMKSLLERAEQLIASLERGIPGRKQSAPPPGTVRA